jgi:hypothetical protein
MNSVTRDNGTSGDMALPGRRGLSIGITIGLRTPDESLWINGIKQNALFLAKLFQGSELGHRVLLLNTTDVPISAALPWDLRKFETRPFEEGYEGLDVVVELGGQISPDQTVALKKQGTKIVSYCCGPEYIQNIEAMIFSRPLYSSLFINPDYDCLWLIPQVYELNRGFLQAFRRCPARIVPFVWDPMALDAATSDLSNAGEYRPRRRPKRLTVIEPNIDVLKFCLYPILICELAFRKRPDDIEFLHVANSDRFVNDDGEFALLMRQCDIVRAQKASFIGRVATPSFLAGYTDIVVSHQWGLPLNYFYLECCWQGYPLIHNAELISDLGYYYAHSEVDAGAEQLLGALHNHDAHWKDYTERQRQGIWRFHSENPDLIREYDDLLFDLMSATGSFEGPTAF